MIRSLALLFLLPLLAWPRHGEAARAVTSLGAWTLWQEAAGACSAATRHADGLLLRLEAHGGERRLTLVGTRWQASLDGAEVFLAIDDSLPWRLPTRLGPGDRLTLELSHSPDLLAHLRRGSQAVLLGRSRALLLDLGEIAPAWLALERCADP